MQNGSIVLRSGMTSAAIESDHAVHLVRAASYECTHANDGLTISFELCPSGNPAKREAAELLGGPVRKITLTDLRIQRRLHSFLRGIKAEGLPWWVKVRFGQIVARYRVTLALSLASGIEMQVVEEKPPNAQSHSLGIRIG